MLVSRMSSTPPPMCLTTSLPAEILIFLTRFLESRDVLALSFTCSRLLGIYSSDHLWLQFFQRERIKRENSLTKVARTELAQGRKEKQNYPPVSVGFYEKQLKCVYVSKPLAELTKKYSNAPF